MPGKSPSSTMRRWMEKADAHELPILATTLGQIQKALSSEEYSTFALARVILQDPPLTTKVLRVANSVYYNPGGQTISMVSRAVMVLGFDVVRSICTTIAVIDAFLHGPARQRLLDEIARALYTAVVARRLATHRHDPSPEEVFVSTLLSRLGHMVFWSLSEPESDLLDQELKADCAAPEMLETRILGFTLADLSEPLAEQWGLPLRMFERSSTTPESRRKLQETARSATDAIARGSDLALESSIREIAWILSSTPPEASKFLRDLAHETAQMARALGADEVARRVPGQSADAFDVLNGESSLSSLGEADQDTELHVLHEIAANLLEGLDVNSVLEMVLEGIHRGVGMDRTALAFLDPRSGEVRCKFVLGVHRRTFMDGFRFALDDTRRHPLADVMDKCRSALIDPASPDMAQKLDHPVYRLFEGRPFLAQAVALRGRPVGLFLADRHSSGRAVDRDAWDNFRLLVRQADIALALAANERG